MPADQRAQPVRAIATQIDRLLQALLGSAPVRVHPKTELLRVAVRTIFVLLAHPVTFIKSDVRW